MKTLQDLKNDLQIGTVVILTSRRGQTEGANIGTQRKVDKVGKTFVKVNGSQLDFPYASLMDYDGENLTIYDKGYRELTEEEKNIIANEPSKRPENKERVKNDILSDGSSMFYADKAYYHNLGKKYLTGHSDAEQNGELYSINKNMVRTNKIKGEVALTYKIIKAVQ